MEENTIRCEKTDSKIKVYNFTKEHMDKTFYFHVLKLDGSLFFWVGNADKTMKNLCVAVNTNYVSKKVEKSINQCIYQWRNQSINQSYYSIDCSIKQ